MDEEIIWERRIELNRETREMLEKAAIEIRNQHDTRQRTEAADATRTHETVDTEAGHETTGIHTANNNNKRETTTHKTHKGNKRE